ncbi:hypothetical protein ABPG74_020198 [Tetrahymena malaccensis]
MEEQKEDRGSIHRNITEGNQISMSQIINGVDQMDVQQADPNIMNQTFGEMQPTFNIRERSDQVNRTNPSSHNNQKALISIEEFSKIAPNVRALEELCIIQGFYIPKQASMKWLLQKYMDKHLPLLDKIKKCPPYSKPTKQECIECIDKYCKELQPESRHDIQWLRDIAYSLSYGKEEIFDIFRSSKNKKNQNGSAGQIQFHLPFEIDERIKQQLQTKYKPERLATTKFLGQLRERMQEKLISCGICLENSIPLCYTMCCKQPLHRACKERMMENTCPYCKNSNRFDLQNDIKDFSRAYSTLN